MKFPIKTIIAAGVLAVAPAIASATSVVFDTNLLQTATNVTSDGLTLDVTGSNGGTVETYSLAGPQGIYLGGGGSGFSIFGGPNNTSGSYNLNFSSAISSIEIRFGFLTGNATSGEEVFNFAADGSPVFALLSDTTGTSQDSMTGLVSSSVPNGLGTLTYDALGSGFTDFSFDHTQEPSNIGFILSNITVELAPVPLPAALPLLLFGVGGLAVAGRRRRL